MAEISRKEWKKYCDILSSLSTRAADDFKYEIFNQKGRWYGMGIENIPRNDLIDFAYFLITKYSEGSVAVACQMYDELAEASGVILPPAEPADIASYQDVAKTVNGTIKRSLNEEIIGASIGRLVKQAGQDTTIKNAIRDKCQMAWIPLGDTCAFCLLLAAKGWEDASPDMYGENGHAAHIHSNCDCSYGVRFDKTTSYAGYDPVKYKRIYANAEGATEEQKLNSMRREFYAENSEKINEQKRSAYEKRKERESSEAEEMKV